MTKRYKTENVEMKNERMENRVQKLYNKLREQYVSFCTDFNELPSGERFNRKWQLLCKVNFDRIIREVVTSVEQQIEEYYPSKYLTWDAVDELLAIPEQPNLACFAALDKLLRLAKESVSVLKVVEEENNDDLSEVEYDELRERLNVIDFIMPKENDYEKKSLFKACSRKTSKEPASVQPSAYVPSIDLEALDSLEGKEFRDQIEIFELLEPMCMPILNNFHIAVVCMLLLRGGIDLGMKRAVYFHCKEAKHYSNKYIKNYVGLAVAKMDDDPELVCDALEKGLHLS